MQLQNPIWYALVGPHRHLAQALDHTVFYPSAIAPFIAIPSADVMPELSGAVSRGLLDPAYFAGVLPRSLPDGWRYTSQSAMLSMIFGAEEIPATDETRIRVLGVADRPRMLALAEIAFPDYFRARTAELGEYLGVFDGEQLVAMAGERMALDGLQEISGVCTRPEYAGRGHARRLTNALLRRHRRRGVTSFLHVSESNGVAQRLYQSIGFTVHARLALGKIEHTHTVARTDI